MPDFTWKWWWERVFALVGKIEKRDYAIACTAIAFFMLIWTGKIGGEHVATIVTGIVTYAVGRPNSRKGGGE